MDSSRRIVDTLRFRPADYPPLMDMGYWNETMDRWDREGLPAHVLQLPEGDYLPGVDLRTYWGGDYENRMRIMQVEDHFGMEHWLVPPRLPIIDTVYPFYEVLRLGESGDKVLLRDRLGVVMEVLREGTAFPRMVEFPVKNERDYDELLPRLDQGTAGRYCQGWEQWAGWLAGRSQPISVWFRGFFGFPRDLLGLEGLCMGYHDQPDLVRRIVEDRCAFVKRLFEPALRSVHIHFVLIWEDMAYNHGPMISPRTFRQFMLPYYQDICQFFHHHGVDRVLVDCDGQICELTRLFLEGGADGMYPLEIAAGSHPAILRQRYPDAALMGGVDKRALAAGPAAIDRELERLLPLVKQGGFVPMVDHLVPPDVSLDNYRYYLRRRGDLFGSPVKNV